jgi:hypothetical protein
MPVNFFETELHKLQDRFNETFGTMVTCDLKARQKTILKIAGLGLLERKISTANKDSVRGEIRKFVKTKDNLNSFFNSIENHQNERRNHAEPKHHVDRTGNPRPGGGSVRTLRQHL